MIIITTFFEQISLDITKTLPYGRAECARYLFATQPSSFIKNNINFRSVALRPNLSIGLPNFIL